MGLTDAQRQKIWLVSDTILYPQAVALMKKVKEHEDVKQLPKRSQVMGLLNIIDSIEYLKDSRYSDVLAYIDQRIKRNVDRVFYEELRQALNDIERKRLQQEFQLVTPQPTKQEEAAEKYELLRLLAREFVQHIIAELGMLRPDKKGDESNG